MTRSDQKRLRRLIKRIEDRYYQQTPEHKDGQVDHLPYCMMKFSKVCTCGLLEDLNALDDWESATLLFAAFFGEDKVHRGNLIKLHEGR